MKCGLGDLSKRTKENCSFGDVLALFSIVGDEEDTLTEKESIV